MISVFRDINKFVGKYKWLDLSAIFCAVYLPFLMVFLLFLFAALENEWKILFYLIASALLARYVIDSLIYYFYKEKRPAYSRGTKILIPVPKNPSFPSSHATVFSAISFSLFFFNLPFAVIFIIASCFIGIARVFCGVHWFRDIVGGFAVGFVTSVAVYYLLNFIIK